MLRILDRIYLGAASASSGGGSVDESRIIVKSATIPTAGENYLGSVYMYVGETNSTYTHGYIYECVENGSTYAWERIDVQPGAIYTAGTGIDITDGVISGTDYVEIVNFTRDLTDTSVLKIIPSTSGYTFPKDKIYVMSFSLRQDPVQGEPTQIDDNTPITIQDGTGRGINFMISGYQATTFKDIKALLRSKVNQNNKRTTYYGYIIGTLNGVGSAPYNMSFNVFSANNNPVDMQTTTNLVTSVSSASTDTQYPSAKLFYDTVGNIETALHNINSGS